MDWPGAMTAVGNEGVAQRVKITTGAIGYMGYEVAHRLGLPVATLQNKAGTMVAPNPQDGQLALASVGDQVPADLRLFVPDPDGTGSYPIVGYTWVVLDAHYADPAKAQALKEALGWGLGEGQSFAGAMGYVGKVRFDLAAIERSLRAVQRGFDRINATLETPRDPLRDQVITNLMAGYADLDRSLAQGRNPLAPGHSADLLQLNHLVLCGTDEADLKDAAKHLAETAAGFYDTAGPGGVAELMSTLAAHRDEPVWRQAARAYIQVMSQPQLFIEGNHRTGALIMSALLAGEGKPPFVLRSRASGRFTAAAPR